MRTGLSWSPASERSKDSLHVLWNAAASSVLIKFFRCNTYGDVERNVGSYSGYSALMRSKSRLSSPSGTAAVVLSREQRSSRGLGGLRP